MKYAAIAALAFLVPPALADSLAANWSLEVGRDEQTWENVATLGFESVNEIADEYATKKVHPQLAFLCKPGGDGTISVRLDWHRYMSSFNTEVGFKADDRELLLVNWGVDKSKQITLPRSAGDSQELISYLAGAANVQVEVIPYSASLITVQFNISGIDEALQALTAKCS
jgi:hypothetical protein